MLDAWVEAWRQAVANFRQELSAGDGASATELHREIDGARAALRQLEHELARVRHAHGAEAAELDTCRRREAMARRIGDDETADVAAAYAARHAERAAVLARKADVLAQELALRMRDVEEMKRVAQQCAESGAVQRRPT